MPGTPRSQAADQLSSTFAHSAWPPSSRLVSASAAATPLVMPHLA
jgi:hypothetical protein